MILFVISFLLIFTSTYFITSIIAPQKNVLGCIYFSIIAFAQIVLTLEILSVISGINPLCIIGMNILFADFAFYIWYKKGKPIFKINTGNFFKRFLNSMRMDKSLIWLFVGWLVFVLSALFLVSIMPVTSADGQGYHVARSLFWSYQGSLNHFVTSDVRALCLPINSEILYAWVLTFTKTGVLLGFFSFVGYLLSIVSVYNILGLIGFCTRKKLWAVLILSSFASVLVQASGTETDIIVAGLITSSVFLFWHALKNKQTAPVFMASLAYALAVGTKTTAIIAIPAVGLLLVALCAHYKNFKALGKFLGFGAANFLIFSSFNYVLNLIHFGNIMGSESFLSVSKNYFGFGGMVANFIKNLFLFFDFTGLAWAKLFGASIADFREWILNFFGVGYVQDGLYSSKYRVNSYLLEPLMGAGVLGLLVYVPCLIKSLLNPFFHIKSEKAKFLFGFGGIFFLNVLVMSCLIPYMSYNARFLMLFVVVSSPVLIYSYFSNKNPIKYVIVFFSLFYLVFVSTNLWARPSFKVVNILKSGETVGQVRFRALCQDFEKKPLYSNSACVLNRRILLQYSQKNRILALMSAADNIYTTKLLEKMGYKIDFALLENSEKIDFSKYNLILIRDKGQSSTVIEKFGEKRLNEKLIPCEYNFNKKNQQADNGHLIFPYQVTCKFSGEFLTKEQFRKVGTAGVVNPAMNEYSLYEVYESTKLPIDRVAPLVK